MLYTKTTKLYHQNIKSQTQTNYFCFVCGEMISVHIRDSKSLTLPFNLIFSHTVYSTPYITKKTTKPCASKNSFVRINRMILFVHIHLRFSRNHHKHIEIICLCCVVLCRMREINLARSVVYNFLFIFYLADVLFSTPK